MYALVGNKYIVVSALIRTHILIICLITELAENIKYLLIFFRSWVRVYAKLDGQSLWCMYPEPGVSISYCCHRFLRSQYYYI